MTEGRIPFWLGALISYGIVVIYVATGGLRAAAWSDVFQGLLNMIIVSWVVGLSIVHQLHGGTTEMFAKIAKESPAFLQIGKDGSNMGTVAYSTTILVSVIGFLCGPFIYEIICFQFSNYKKTVLAYPIFALFLVPLLLVGFAAVGVVDAEKIAKPQIKFYHINYNHYEFTWLGLRTRWCWCTCCCNVNC